MFADVVPSFDFGIIILYEIIACARVLLMRHLEETSQISAADFFYRNNLFEHRRLHRMLTDQDTECCPRWIRLRHRQETEEEEDVVLTDISELSAQEVKLCLKEPLGQLWGSTLSLALLEFTCALPQI